MARGTRSSISLLGVVRRRRSALMVSTALQATVVLVLAVPPGTAHAQPAPNARPAGGQVVAGAAAISQSPSTTTITQSSQRAAVNWRSFDVGASQTVQFQQPSTSAATLNRVTGPNPSQIAGRINANGQVILVNQDGITFYRGAQVNAAGLVASAPGITNQNFMAGRMVFDQAAHPNARVENQGTITVQQTGLAALVAPQVANSGVINARLGHVVLAGASAATLDLYGDGLLAIDVTQQVTQVPVGPNGKPVTALVTNSGTVLADGGTVQLTARAADGIVQNLITAGGRIAAGSVGSRTGEIALNGIGGSITVTGQLAATGQAPGSTGGQIEVVTDRGVTLTRTARLDASGRAGGGTVAIGTTLARANGGRSVKARQTAMNVTVQAGARIDANSSGNGNGGRIAVLSTDATQMDGAISATGGPQGGDGGIVEVSGNTLGLNGSIDVSSPVGQTGTILLDPGTLDIINSATNDGSLDGSFSGGTIASGVGGTLGTVTNFEINALGLNGNVVLQATTLLDVQASVSVAHGLTMESGGDLLVDPGLAITAGTTLLLGSGIDFAGGTVAINAGSIALGFSDANPVSLTAATLIMQGGTTGIALNNSVLTASTIDISAAGGGVAQLNTGTILAAGGILQSSSGIVGGLTLPGTANAIGTLRGLNVNGDVTVFTNSPLDVVGTVAADGHTISLTANGGPLAIGTADAAGLLSTGTVSGGVALAASGGISEPDGSIVTPTLTAASSGADVLLTGGFDQIGTIAGITAAGRGAVIENPGTLTITGASSGTTLLFENSGPVGANTISLNQADLIATGTIGVAPRISLVGDRLTQVGVNAINTTGVTGVVELAPFNSSTDVTVGGTADTVAAVLSAIVPQAGTLAIGAFHDVNNVAHTTAHSITIADTLDLGAVANTLALLSNGAISQGSIATPVLVGTLTGTATGFTLLDPGNQIGTIAALTATGIGGNIGIINSIQVQIAGPVSALNGNVLLEDGADGGMNLAGTVSAQNGGTVSLATNFLTESGTPILQALGGTVEIAPFTAQPVQLAGAEDQDLTIDTTALGAVRAAELRIGGFHGPGDTVTATTIEVVGPVVLGTAAVPTLRLDALGGIGEQAIGDQASGSLVVGTLDAMASGSVILTDGPNAIGTLGTIAVTGGDFDLNNFANLAVPSTSTVFASNVFVTNTGTVTIDGAIGASETTPALGTLSIQAIGSPIVVGSDVTKTPLIGAFGTVALLAGGIFTQNGGLINGGAVTIAAGNDGTVATAGMAFSQAGGTILALAPNLAGPSLALSATGDFIQGGTGTIASNSAPGYSRHRQRRQYLIGRGDRRDRQHRYHRHRRRQPDQQRRHRGSRH